MQVTTISKKWNLFTKFFAKNKSVESTDHESSLPDATLPKISIENTDKDSKAEKRKFQAVCFCGSFMIPVMTLSIVIFAERQAQIFKLSYFKILIKKTLTLLIILYFFYEKKPKKNKYNVATQSHKKWGWVQESKNILSHLGH